MSVNIEYYKAFYYVATSGSMSKASEIMALTPPTITKTIQNLEDQLGCQLFIRSAKGVQLTDAAEALLEYVRPGLNLLSAGEREISQLNALESGKIRFVIIEECLQYLALPTVFGKFCEAFPKIRLIITHLPRQEALDSLLIKDNDFAIMALNKSEELHDFEVRQIYESTNIPVAGNALRHLSQKNVTLSELQQYPLIFTYSGYSIREHYENLFRKHGLTFSPNIETPTLDIQMKMVMLGLGYSFCPYSHVKESLEKGDLFRLSIKEEQEFKRQVCIVTAKDIPTSRASNTLINTILQSANKNWQ